MNLPIDLRSDTVSRPTEAMRQAMAAAEVGDDVFGEDPTVRLLEETTARLLGKEAALYIPSGHMGNEIALWVHGRPGREVIVEELSHVMCSEGGAPAALARVTLRPLPSKAGGLDPARVEAALVLDDDPHHAPTVLACVENTHNRHGGRIYPAAAMTELAARLGAHGIPLHLDGARVWNAAAALSAPPADLAGPADTVMVCYSKGLGAPVGSALAGPVAFIREAHRTRKLFGGGMRQAGILAAACLHALAHHRERLVDDHRRARRLADLVDLPEGASVLGGRPETNIVIWQLPTDRFDVVEIRRRLAAEAILMSDFGPGRLRAVTHLDVDDAGIERAGYVLNQVLAGIPARPVAAR
ncbi:MAG: GntG family PLP-dependent aldolase [Candidatus Eisenbacteria bacterium]|nr:GntG family PLP-dependent aldolase [Candidatus Eisenbacteria bacterium]